MREICTSGSVRGGDGNVPIYSAVYGSRRLQVALLREGISVGRRRVRRLMKKLGLWAVRPKRNTSKRHPEHKVYPYLLRGKTIDQPNQSLPSRKRGYGQLT